MANTLTSPAHIKRGGEAACGGTYCEHSEGMDPQKVAPKKTGYVDQPMHISGTIIEEEQEEGYISEEHKQNFIDGNEMLDYLTCMERWGSERDDNDTGDEDYVAEELCTVQMCGEFRNEIKRSEVERAMKNQNSDNVESDTISENKPTKSMESAGHRAYRHEVRDQANTIDYSVTWNEAPPATVTAYRRIINSIIHT